MAEQQECSFDTCTDKVEEKLVRFKSEKSNFIKWPLYFLPLGILIAIVFIILHYDITAGRVMYVMGLLTAAVSLLAFQILMEKIPKNFAVVWDRKVIVDCRNESGHATDTEEEQGDDGNTSTIEKEDFKERYLQFIQHFEDIINSPFKILSGIIFSLFVFTWKYNSIAEFLIAFVIGIMAWKMTVTAIYIWKMGNDFCFEPQLGHADKCGGLSPLGDLCLWNAIIVTIPAVYLASWIIIGMITEPDSSYFLKSMEYSSLFFKLLLVPAFFAIIAFFLPLWSTHQVMLKWRKKKQSQMDHLEQLINKLESRILEDANNMDEKEYEQIFREREIMEQIYHQSRRIPVWPFNISIISKFLLSQSIPFFGIISHALNFIKQIP
ncbi:MAG: hypothetical protein PWQ75_1127 [Methanolobus sp.]|uniref:hypothetical protein n=1 Tax=Methanolobus sp. TaxID=1874737 RepID=UPI002585D7F9|nr:hypothetical protein [Methanolobus sp.]MDK2831375.1 hypothetical protein [Methanolobus sp.]